jgi:serine/threonine protein kinase
MATTTKEFVAQLENSGIVPAAELDPYRTLSCDPQDLAQQLVSRQHLTDFQAKELLRGRAGSLVLGNYILLDKIGAGGMGQVFKARHRRMDRIVAIKLLPERMMQDRAWISRFEREVHAAAKLSHPNIVAAYDADEFDGIHFLAMEYVDGKDLSTLIRERGPLPYLKAIKAILQVAKGLEFAHSKGVIHRDIKPANLLLDTKGAIRILDMGLARIDSHAESLRQDDLTGSGAMMGTVSYMAPEQAIDAKHADARADIYSLGCTLHFLLLAKAPYDGDSLMATLLAHREQGIPSLSTAKPDIPSQLDIAFRRMVAKRAEDRYQTMSEVVAELKQFLASPNAPSQIRELANPQALSDTVPSRQAAAMVDGIDLLMSIPADAVSRSRSTRKSLRSGRRNKWLSLGVVAAAFFSVMMLVGAILKMQTRVGTLVVATDQPDAEIQILNDEGIIQARQTARQGTTSILVDPGKHHLKVTKGGFGVFRQDFAMTPGGSASISAVLEPTRAADGRLAVEIDQPDAEVEVLSEQGNIEVRQRGILGTSSISVGPGKHRVKVSKEGFAAFAAEFSVKPGDTASIKAVLVPVSPIADAPASPMLPNGNDDNAASNGDNVASLDARLPNNVQPLQGELATTNEKLNSGDELPPVAKTDDNAVPSVKLPKQAPKDAAQFKGHAYKFFFEVLTWHQAKSRCEEMGGHLPIIETEAENNFVAALAEKGIALHREFDGVWLGATDERQEGEWEWINGKKSKFTKWNAGQPNNKGNAEHYLFLWLLHREWCDQPAQSLQHTTYFVCEWDAPEKIRSHNPMPVVAPKVDSLVQPNSVWVNDDGTLTLTIRERRGGEFRATFSLRRLDREVTGTIKNGKLSWLAQNVQAANGNIGGDNSGTIHGETIDFEWKDPNGSSGRYTLHLQHHE